MTPNLTSLSSPAFTSSGQWSGTGMGVWFAVGVAEGSIVKRMGGSSMRGRVWCSQVLNVLER